MMIPQTMMTTRRKINRNHDHYHKIIINIISLRKKWTEPRKVTSWQVGYRILKGFGTRQRFCRLWILETLP